MRDNNAIKEISEDATFYNFLLNIQDKKEQSLKFFS